MSEPDRLLEVFGVTREEIDSLDPSYTQAVADAAREMRELERKVLQRGQDIAADLTERLHAEGFDGVIKFNTEKLW